MTYKSVSARAIEWITGLSIRKKLLWSISAAFLLTVIGGGSVMYTILKQVITHLIEDNLRNVNAIVLDSIKNASTNTSRPDINHIRNIVLSIHLGKKGYPFIIDTDGNIIVHAKLKGNFYNATDGHGQFFVQRMCRQKNGQLYYTWKNPDESSFRDKVAVFNYMPQHHWIVASSVYLDEYFKPIHKLRDIVLGTMLATFLLLLGTTFVISVSISKPIKQLIQRIASEKTFSNQPKPDTHNEIAQLCNYIPSLPLNAL